MRQSYVICCFVLSTSVFLSAYIQGSGKELPANQVRTDSENRDYLEKEDKELLLIFSSLVSCFANILKDPNNPRTLAINLTGIATGILNMLLSTMSCKVHPLLVDELIKIKALTAQRFRKKYD